MRAVFLGSTETARALERTLVAREGWSLTTVASATELGDRLRAAEVDVAIAETDTWLTTRGLVDALAANARPCPVVALVGPEVGPADVVQLVREGASEVWPRDALDRLPDAAEAAVARAAGPAADTLSKAARLQSLGELAAGVTHDLNNLLAVAGTFVSLARDHMEPGDAAIEDLDEAHGALVRAGALTRRVVAFLRKDRGALQPFDVNETIRSLDRLMSCALGSRIRLAVSLASDLPPVLGDPAEIEQVLLNLVVNARDAIEERGNVIIATHLLAPDAHRTLSDSVGRRIVVTVTDDGAGMDADVQRSIFEPFFTTKERGTGLGLSNSLQIVRRHRGVMRVRSAPGEGSTFEVHLPVASRSASARVSRPGRKTT